MGLTAKDNGGRDFEKVPAGAHFACCYQIVDLGLQEGTTGKPQHKIYVRFEVPDERIKYQKDGKDIDGPMTIGTFYTLSLSKKAFLRRDLENWRGLPFTETELKGFDIFNVIGKCCQIQVVHTDDGKYANIGGVMGLAKEQKPRARTYKPESEVVGFSLEDPKPEIYDLVPEWLQRKIEARMEEGDATTTTASSGAGKVDEDFNDDIPF
jgi:hypothetical protein